MHKRRIRSLGGAKRDIGEADREPSFDEFSEALERSLRGLGRLTSEQIQRLYRHFVLLRSWGRVINLTRVSELTEAVELHYCESLWVAWRLPAGELRILDWGSGAGLPGVPIAVARPESYVILAEARSRKAAFLKEVTRGWHNVRVYVGRAEDLGPPFDVVVSRAVRPELVVDGARRLGAMLAVVTGERGMVQLRDCAGLQLEKCEKIPWGKARFLVVASPK